MGFNSEIYELLYVRDWKSHSMKAPSVIDYRAKDLSESRSEERLNLRTSEMKAPSVRMRGPHFGLAYSSQLRVDTC